MNWDWTNWDWTNWDWDAIAGIAALIGLISIPIAVVAVLITHRASKDQRAATNIERQRRADEEQEKVEKSKQAQFEVTVGSCNKVSGKYVYDLNFRNYGPSDAWDVYYRVRWEASGKWGSEGWKDLVPFNPSIPPQTRVEPVPIGSGFDVELKWSDNARPKGASNRFRFDGNGKLLRQWVVDGERDRT